MVVRYAKRPRSTGVVTAPLESKAQEMVFTWARTQRIPGTIWPLVDHLFAIPNGQMLAGNRVQRAKYMAALKRRGFKAGVSDLMLAWPVGGHNGAFFEMKRACGSVMSDEQSKFLCDMICAGYYAVRTNGFEETVQAIDDYLNKRVRHA
jgi:hypothetical protein